MEEYVNQPYNKEHKLFQYVAEICELKSQGGYVGFSAISTATDSDQNTYLYFNGSDFTKI